ncbi:hypothetical protein BN1423_1090004 [Carnobacterium maltaromaticum]|nr:hypothetical protein CM318V1_440050 [Carnobacterium maltaromaticum]CRH20689.1 hypothetical protein BN1423_1090004 [Carnobacterium maltaromaticum]
MILSITIRILFVNIYIFFLGLMFVLLYNFLSFRPVMKGNLEYAYAGQIKKRTILIVLFNHYYSIV